MNIHQVLIRPTITEKSTLLQESGKYTFQVALKANKVEVKEAVELGDVDVQNRHSKILLHGKTKRFGARVSRQPDIKKAVVTLQPGDRITLVEGL